MASYIDFVTLLILMIYPHDLSILHKSWIRPAIEYGCVLYSGAVPNYLHHFDNKHMLNVRISSPTYFHF